MTPRSLGRLEKVELRTVWSREAEDFTPWLAEKANLALLGDTLGMELELEAQEKDVGPYSADIFCRNTADDTWVVIENQLEKTDHSHLGQILTYAAGLSAVTVVWIAQRFTDEHRAALDWLNEVSTECARFFGLEIEAWRIGESQPAPKFNIVAKPNDWVKTEKAQRTDLTPTQALQLDFWHGFREYMLDSETRIKPGNPGPRYYMNFSLGRGGFISHAIATYWDSDAEKYGSGELRAGLYIHDKKHAKAYFNLLLEERAHIEQEFDCPLVWQNPEHSNPCWVFARKSTHLDDMSDRANQYAWLLENLEKIHRVFAERVLNLEVPSEVIDGKLETRSESLRRLFHVKGTGSYSRLPDAVGEDFVDDGDGEE